MNLAAPTRPLMTPLTCPSPLKLQLGSLLPTTGMKKKVHGQVTNPQMGMALLIHMVHSLEPLRL